MRVSEEVQRRGLTVKFNIRARVDTVDREVVRALKKAGLRSIHMGVEAGTDRVLKIMNKQITREQTERSLPHLPRGGRRYPRLLHGRLLRHDPRRRRGHDQVRGRARPGLGELLSVATALPATDLYRIANERGYVNEDFWRQYTIDGGGVIPQLETETFTAEQLRAYRTKAYMKFYLRPTSSGASSPSPRDARNCWR